MLQRRTSPMTPLDMQSDEEYLLRLQQQQETRREQIKASFRNIYSVVRVPLAIFMAFTLIGSTFQDGVARQVAVACGAGVSMAASAVSIFFHWPLFWEERFPMLVMVFLANVAPVGVFCVIYYVTGEYRFAQNKQPR